MLYVFFFNLFKLFQEILGFSRGPTKLKVSKLKVEIQFFVEINSVFFTILIPFIISSSI